MNKWLCIKKNIHVMEYCRDENARREKKKQMNDRLDQTIGEQF
jgi:TnpA family transposase